MPSSSSIESNAAILRKIAAVLGASGVGLGAIGAHAFKETLAKRGMAASWQTATIYQLFHATAILGVSSMLSMKGDDGASRKAAVGDKGSMTFLAGQLLSLGTIMFSGSIYCLALNIGPKAVMGPSTPLGGLLMIGGWVVVGLL